MPVSWIPREIRRKYLKNYCEFCGDTREQVKARHETLQLHHMDLNRKNNTPENLKTACTTCHTNWHWEHGKDYDFEDMEIREE